MFLECQSSGNPDLALLHECLSEVQVSQAWNSGLSHSLDFRPGDIMGCLQVTLSASVDTLEVLRPGL